MAKFIRVTAVSGLVGVLKRHRYIFGFNSCQWGRIR